MSIKLYNGYKLPKMTAREMIDFCKPIRERLTEMKIELYSTFLAEQITHYIDDVYVGVIKPKEEDLKDGAKLPKYLGFKFKDENNKKMREARIHNQRELDLDFEFSVSFFPMSRYTLAMTFCENAEMSNYWESLPGVESYYYQNSTDRPNNVTARAWKKRYNDWHNALNDFGSASENGLSYKLCEHELPYFMGNEILLKKVPSFDKRLHRVAVNKFESNFMNIELDELKRVSGPDFKFDSSDYIHSFGHARDASRTDGGRSQIELIKKELEPLLLKEITADLI